MVIPTLTRSHLGVGAYRRGDRGQDPGPDDRLCAVAPHFRVLREHQLPPVQRFPTCYVKGGIFHRSSPSALYGAEDMVEEARAGRRQRLVSNRPRDSYSSICHEKKVTGSYRHSATSSCARHDINLMHVSVSSAQCCGLIFFSPADLSVSTLRLSSDVVCACYGGGLPPATASLPR